jgi:Rrf2 family protein
MLKISSQEEFGLRLLVQMARAENQEISLSELAEKEGISLTYVRKIFGILRHGGLVQASKGFQGGYSLIKPAKQINLKEVFDALKNPEIGFDCSYFSGNLSICANHGDCAVRPLISLLNSKIDDFLSNINLSQLVKEEREVMFHLAAKV